MGNIAKSISEQIEILKNRGIILDMPNEKIEEILLDIGYYRLGFYWFHFFDKKNAKFVANLKFSNVVDLYYLDVDLRNIMSKAINRIEINFRTKLVYHISNKYKKSNTWFVDSKIVNMNFIKDIDSYYNNNFKRNKTIKNHHNKYINDKYAPAWKTIEYFTFGAVLKIYKSLKIEIDKEIISNLYNVKNVDKFTNYLETIKFIRNVCAHGGVLFDLNTPKEIEITPLIKFNNNNRHSLDSSIKVILYFLGKISETRREIIEEEIKELFNKHKNNPLIYNIIKEKIGFDVTILK